MPEDLKPVAMRVLQQGAVRVNHAHAHRSGDGVVAIYVDLASKRIEIDGTGSGDEDLPCLWLAAASDSLHLDESHPRTRQTVIEFPEYPDWQVFSAAVTGRYTIALCLTTPNPELRIDALHGH